MRRNISQSARPGPDGWRYIDYDWYGRGIPPNVHLGDDVYIDSSYGFSAFNATAAEAMKIGANTGCYDRATFVTGKSGHIVIGSFSIINGATIISEKQVRLGDHCMLAWGAVITDSWLPASSLSRRQRAGLLLQAAGDPNRSLPLLGPPREVVLQDNCWIGFDAVVLAGVTIGRSAIVGSKSVVYEDIPDYAIAVGNPARIIRFLMPDDTPDVKNSLLREYGFPIPER